MSKADQSETRILLDEVNWWQAGRLLVWMLLSALTEGVGIVLLVPLLSALIGGGAGGDRITAWLQGWHIPPRLDFLLPCFVALVLLRGVINLQRTLAGVRFEIDVVNRLRARALDALLHADWRTVSQMRQTDNLSLLISTIDRVGEGVGHWLSSLSTLLTLCGIGIAALAISPTIALGGMLGGVLVLIAYRAMRRQASAIGDQLADAYREVHGRLGESLGALRVIKSLGLEGEAASDGMAAFHGLRAAQLGYVRNANLGQLALQVGGTAVLALLIWLGVSHWHASAATILPLVALFARALPLLGILQEASQNWAYCRAAVRDTANIIHRAEAVRESDSPQGPPPRLNTAMQLDRVSVRFPAGSAPALDGISVEIPARRVTALIGPSGSGKSTLADLACGLLDPDSGQILIDGTPLDAPTRRAWRGRVAYVQQDPVIFFGTLRQNLACANRSADDTAMWRALDCASATFTRSLPHGLDTLLGEGARRLSGGERQRLMLARALMREPDLLVLDEATSALDAENDTAIAEAIAALKGQLTIIIICHRGALFALADKTITLNGGRLESGPAAQS